MFLLLRCNILKDETSLPHFSPFTKVMIFANSYRSDNLPKILLTYIIIDMVSLDQLPVHWASI